MPYGSRWSVSTAASLRARNGVIFLMISTGCRRPGLSASSSIAALGLDRAVLPYRTSGEGPQAPKRFVVLKFPVAVDAKAATFVYVDLGLTTDSELRAWGCGPRAALGRAADEDVRRARRRRRPGCSGGRPGRVRAHTLDPRRRRPGRDAPRRADPDIRQELARLEEAIRGGNRVLLSQLGGWEKASDRYLYLSQLPEGTPTKTTAKGAIDRYSTWSTVRLISPEVAT